MSSVLTTIQKKKKMITRKKESSCRANATSPSKLTLEASCGAVEMMGYCSREHLSFLQQEARYKSPTESKQFPCSSSLGSAGLQLRFLTCAQHIPKGMLYQGGRLPPHHLHWAKRKGKGAKAEASFRSQMSVSQASHGSGCWKCSSKQTRKNPCFPVIQSNGSRESTNEYFKYVWQGLIDAVKIKLDKGVESNRSYWRLIKEGPSQKMKSEQQ